MFIMTYARILNNDHMNLFDRIPQVNTEDTEIDITELFDDEELGKGVKKSSALSQKIVGPSTVSGASLKGKAITAEEPQKKEDPYAWDKITAAWVLTAILLIIFIFVIV